MTTQDLFDLNYVQSLYNNPNLLINTLLNNYVIHVKDTLYRMHEVELYLKNTSHDDLYTHTNSDQLLFGKWYFHKFKNGSYKGGTYKGMDLTLGNNVDTYCGILIRSMCKLGTEDIIEGPCNCVNKILSHYGFNDIKSFMADKTNPMNINDSNGALFLEKNDKLEKETIYVGPRIGLSEKYPEYRVKPYRFVIQPIKIKKEKSKLKQISN